MIQNIITSYLSAQYPLNTLIGIKLSLERREGTQKMKRNAKNKTKCLLQHHSQLASQDGSVLLLIQK